MDDGSGLDAEAVTDVWTSGEARTLGVQQPLLA
jgi:hypothetical protein